jgi:methyl-accepting chemotaxis protein
MKRFSDLKIGTRLMFGFIVVALFAAAIGIFGSVNIQRSNARNEKMYTENTMPIASLEKVGVYFQRTRVNMLRIILNDNKEEQQKYLDRLNSFETFIVEGMQEYGAVHSSDENFKNLQTELSAYRETRQEVIDLAMGGDNDDAYDYSIEYELDAATRVNDILDAMFTENVNNAAALRVSNQKTAAQVLIISVVLMAAGISVAVVIGMITTKSIVRPTRKLMDAAEAIAIGDVNITIKSDSADELGQLMAAFERMAENIRAQALVVEKIADGDLTVKVTVRSDRDLLGLKLSEMVKNNNTLLLGIDSSSRQVSMGAENVSSTSQSLAQGSTEQASAIEEISVTVEEITEKTKYNASKAKEAKELADTVKRGADRGNEQVQEMLRSMEDIQQSSESISKIISVIENIAFQTNILALNAAVEAARAGAHGKGFAVVAGEVKNLADKSAKAAKEVTDIIVGSGNKVDQGMKTAQSAADALDVINAEIGHVSSLVSEITSASDEQADGLMQVKAAIQQVASVIQTNTASSEEAAAASEELSGQACLLLEMVEKYTLDEGAYQISPVPALVHKY